MWSWNMDFYFFYIKGSFSILYYKGMNKAMDIKKRLTVIYVALYDMLRHHFYCIPALFSNEVEKNSCHSFFCCEQCSNHICREKSYVIHTLAASNWWQHSHKWISILHSSVSMTVANGWLCCDGDNKLAFPYGAPWCPQLFPENFFQIPNY